MFLKEKLRDNKFGMSNGSWIEAAYALELIASRFAVSKKLDVVSARDEAKVAIVGALVSGHVHACPKGCLTSAFVAGEGRESDFKYYEVDADGNGTPISMQLQHEGDYVFIPPEFWADFRDPAAGASANWHDGDFSFRLVTSARTALVGEVLNVYFDRSSIEAIGALASNTGLMVRTGDPGRPELGKTLYLRELERRIEIGGLEESLRAQAHALHVWFCEEYPDQQSPKPRTIENSIRATYKKAKRTTK